MTSDPEGNPALDAVNGAVNPQDNEITAEAKPKARKKKAAEPVAEVAPVEAVPEFSLEPPPEKPAKKAAKKTAKKAEPAAEPVQEAAVEEAPVEPVAKKPKAAKKAAAKKGRDLVVQEPGAAEVAEVLHHEPEAVAEIEEDDAADEEAEDATPVAAKGPEPKLERLQKILARAGISSRRKAEELILGGRVQINGQVVLELGTKADMGRDHVRVDGKLLQGAERIRYFVLNKPKGYVTTVSDPEGRPTVMNFFASERERLYPVGRLDYLSEGLLLVTNDGELANKLTKASSGVEKTYLVKVAGQPSEEGLDALRSGVVIEKGRGIGSGRVRTAPAQIRQVRQGDNPWFEVIVIEGRNRELRKMFEEIGHHVEKIRRIGYGPLILDLEPGKMRELEAEEVNSLRLASEGKLKTRRRRGPAAAQLPTVAGKTVRYKKADGKPAYEKPSASRFAADSESGFKKEFKPAERRAVRPEFQQESKRDFNPSFKTDSKPSFKKEFKPAFKKEFQAEGKSGFKRDAKPEFRPAGRSEFRPSGAGPSKPGFKSGSGGSFKPAGGVGFKAGGGAGFKSSARPAFGGKPRANRPAEPPVIDYVLPPRKSAPFPDDEFDQPEPRKSFGKPGGRPAPLRQAVRDVSTGMATGKRMGAEARPAPRDPATGLATGKRLMITEEPARSADRPANRPAGRPSGDFEPRPFKKPFSPRPGSSRPGSSRPGSSGPGSSGPRERTGGDARPPAKRPFVTREGRDDRGGSRGFQGGAGRSADRSSDRRPAREGGESRPRFEGRPGSSPRSASGQSFRPASSGSSFRPNRPASRPAAGAGGRRFEGSGEERPREFRPRTESRSGAPSRSGPPKKFAGARPSGPAGSSTAGPKAGPDGEPRKKERWRNSFTGKNKGRPKPKPKND
ncbi:MAG TPA: pseudouridine synthase [Acidobacteriaceae bacterium]|jgi:23S rRNA pseudouridine2605 synthase|nr:pseudouridine synthase [Acidobacteriaceae bacterium]